MGEKTKNIFITIFYFVIVVAALGSAGIWIPMIIDNYSDNKISDETYNALSSNILTYGLGILIVSIIDRILYLLFKTSEYSNNAIEFLLIMLFSFGTCPLVYYTLKNTKTLQYDEAIKFSIWISIISWVCWFYVKFRGSKDNNFAAIGGII